MFHVKQLEKALICGLTLTKDGVWQHEGVEITHERTVELFNRSLRRKGNKYILQIGDEIYDVQIEDAPFIVKQVRLEGNRLMLDLSNFTSEPLDPNTLEIGRDNVMYARVGKDRDLARFSRPAYYQLAEFIEQGPNNNFILKINNIEITLQIL